MVGNEAGFLQNPPGVLLVLGKNGTLSVECSDFVEVANVPNFSFLSVKCGEWCLPSAQCAVRKNAQKAPRSSAVEVKGKGKGNTRDI